MAVNVNRDGVVTSLQISKIGNVPAGSFNPGGTFLLKNITEDVIVCEITPAGQTESIATAIYPGWNPELCKGVVVANSNTLQYGI